MTTQAIITGNKSRHRFKIGELVTIVSAQETYYMCKGTGIANYIIPFDEIRVINLN
jgi:hypothetical protein